MKQVTPQEDATLVALSAWYAIIGCVIFAISIFIADFVVPDHDWIADTISDLGAGKYEFIVDIGIYSFSAALISIAVLCAHVHLSGAGWNFGIIGFALLGLIVFLVGARNEYGDSDSDGVVIHIYLVYGIGALVTLLPLALARGAARLGQIYRRILIGLSALWVLSAPVFFVMPDGYDGLYERYLGVIAMAVVCTIAVMFIKRNRRRD